MITIKLRPGQDPNRAIQKLKSQIIVEELFAVLKRKRYFPKPCIAKRLKRKEAERQRQKDLRREIRQLERAERANYG